MTRRELFERIRNAAARLYDEREAASVAWIVVADEARLTRIDVMLDPDAAAEWTPRLDEVVCQLEAGRPVQYITGRTEFCGLEFGVREGVLIPRPETEELVAWIVSESAPEQTILDIGTGSGAIAVALADRVPGGRVRAIDISEEALEIASRNAAANDVRVEFLAADILAVPELWEGEWRAGSFDVIVSNPPYIPCRDMSAMHRNVTDYEPRVALFVDDDDPLVFYRAIARHGRWLLRCGGSLWFEIYEEFACEMTELLACEGYVDIEVRSDINGKPRMLRCRKG